MRKDQQILIVEDDVRDAASLQKIAVSAGMKVAICPKLSDFRTWLTGKHSVDYALVDIHLTPDASLKGIEVISELKEKYPDLIIVGMSSDLNQSDNFEILKAGASLYVRKPIENQKELETILDTAKHVSDCKNGRILQISKPERTGRKLKYSYLNEIIEKYPYGIVISNEMTDFIEKVISKAPNCSFLITGPTGSGKEQVAKLIYEKKRKLKGPIPFESVNCALLNTEVGGSHLFGHKRGAFTGADTNRKGAVANAQGGVLFLDEIHTLGIGFQDKLLRFMQDKSYQPIGSDERQYADLGLIFASNADLEKLVMEKKFKEDLYYRMASGEVIRLKSLKESPGILREVAALFFAKNEVDISEKSFENVVSQCEKLKWSGNLRSLTTSLERYLRHSDGQNFDQVKIQSFDLNLDDSATGIGGWVKAKLKENPDCQLMEEVKFDLFDYLEAEGYTREEMAKTLGIAKGTLITIGKRSKST